MTTSPRETERRLGDRRGARRALSADESWFEAFGPVDGVPTSRAPDPADREASAPPSDWLDAEPPGGSSGLVSPERLRADGDGQTTFARLYRTFIGARAVLGLALVVTLGVVTLFGVRPSVAVGTVSVIYAALAISMWLLPRLWEIGRASCRERV